MIVNSKLLKAALASVGNFVPTRSPMEMFTRVRLCTNSGTLQLQTSGRDGTCHATVSVEQPVNLNVWVDYAKLSEFVKKATGDIVSLKPTERGIDVQFGRIKKTLDNYNHDKEWVGKSTSVINKSASLTVNAQDFIECVGRVSYASPKFSADKALAVGLFVLDSTLHFGAGDGTVGAFASCECSGSADSAFSIANDPLKAACAALSGEGENIQICLGSNGVLVTGKSVQALLPLVESGTVPSDRQRMQCRTALDGDHAWEISRADLLLFIKCAYDDITPDCSGVSFEPKGDHVLASFLGTKTDQGAGNALSTGGTVMELEGRAEGVGGKCDLKRLKPMIEHSTDENFRFVSFGKMAYLVESKGYMALCGKMAI